MNERDIGVSVGYQASLTMQVTQQHIDDFAGLCGDWHPMHRDPDYAAKTRFGKTVAHGVTPLALVSAVLGTQVGGPDVTVVQLGQTARFLQPVYAGDTITARCHRLRDGSNGCLLGFLKGPDGSVKDWDGGRDTEVPTDL